MQVLGVLSTYQSKEEIDKENMRNGEVLHGNLQETLVSANKIQEDLNNGKNRWNKT